MFLVGLTGGIATGKSTVTKILTDSNIPVIDADAIARKVVEPGKSAWKKIKSEFGEEIVLSDGTLNRVRLGELIFSSVEKRKKLNSITHPEIIKEIIISVIKLVFQGYSFAVLDIPLLFETENLIKLMHKIIVVTCSENLQLLRLMSRNNLSEEAAKLRISAQIPLDKKCMKADYIIENSFTLKETKDQVDKIIDDLKKSKFHYKIRFGIVFGASMIAIGFYYLFAIWR